MRRVNLLFWREGTSPSFYPTLNRDELYSMTENLIKSAPTDVHNHIANYTKPLEKFISDIVGEVIDIIGGPFTDGG